MKEQIKEIARVLCEKYDTEHCKVCDHHGRCMVRLESEWIYEAGYRKQSEGEWLHTGMVEEEYAPLYRCSVCSGLSYKASYCPHCGARIKGGAE